MTSRTGHNRVDYGLGLHKILSDDANSVFASGQLASELNKVFVSPKYSPPLLPTVAIELHALSRRPDVPRRAILDLLEKDALLAAGLLRRAQSLTFSSRMPVRSLDEAVTRLGLKNVRDVVWELSLGMKVFRANGFESIMESVQMHSTATAYIARVLSFHTSLASEYAFLCGLLHDVGIAASLIVISEHKLTRPKDTEYLASEIDSLHEKTASLISKLWNLPDEIGWVLGSHHSVLVAGKEHPLAASICLAQHIANELGYSISFGDTKPFDISTPKAIASAQKTLQLTPKQLELVQKESLATLTDLTPSP